MLLDGHEDSDEATETFRRHQRASGAMDEMSGKFKMQALTTCNAKIMSTRTATSQFKGAMEELSRQGQKASTHSNEADNVCSPSNVQNVSTHMSPRSGTRLS
eukprot:scaffold49583_cov71-Phaeocystis_antarctica.AAC.2